MSLGMLVIVAAIVVPGYFIINRLSRILYSESNRMDEQTENRYGFQRLENELNEKAKVAQADLGQGKTQYHKRTKRKMIRINKKSDNPVVIKYRSRIKAEKATTVKIDKSDK